MTAGQLYYLSVTTGARSHCISYITTLLITPGLVRHPFGEEKAFF